MSSYQDLKSEDLVNSDIDMSGMDSYEEEGSPIIVDGQIVNSPIKRLKTNHQKKEEMMIHIGEELKNKIFESTSNSLQPVKKAPNTDDIHSLKVTIVNKMQKIENLIFWPNFF